MMDNKQQSTNLLQTHLLGQQQHLQLLKSKKIDILNQSFLPLSQIKETTPNSEQTQQNVNIMKKELEQKGFVDIKLKGEGQQAYVVLAKNSKNNYRYAIKGYKVKGCNGQVFQKEKENHLSYLHEVKSLQKVKGSPYVVNIIQEFEGQQFCYIVLQECQGSLQDLLDQNKNQQLNTELSVIKYSKDIAEGLFYIHSKGILLADIKPANILIDYYGNAVLSDFGLSLQLKNLQSTAIDPNFVGNTLFCAPECLLSNNQLSPPSIRSDAFSLGCLIFSFIPGGNKLIYQNKEDFKFENDLSDYKYGDQLKDIVLGLTKFEPRQRKSIKDVLIILKGIVSIEFGLEEKLYQCINCPTSELSSYETNKLIEIIQTYQNNCILINTQHTETKIPQPEQNVNEKNKNIDQANQKKTNYSEQNSTGQNQNISQFNQQHAKPTFSEIDSKDDLQKKVDNIQRNDLSQKVLKATEQTPRQQSTIQQPQQQISQVQKKDCQEKIINQQQNTTKQQNLIKEDQSQKITFQQDIQSQNNYINSTQSNRRYSNIQQDQGQVLIQAIKSEANKVEQQNPNNLIAQKQTIQQQNNINLKQSQNQLMNTNDQVISTQGYNSQQQSINCMDLNQKQQQSKQSQQQSINENQIYSKNQQINAQQNVQKQITSNPLQNNGKNIQEDNKLVNFIQNQQFPNQQSPNYSNEKYYLPQQNKYQQYANSYREQQSQQIMNRQSIQIEQNYPIINKSKSFYMSSSQSQLANNQQQKQGNSDKQNNNLQQGVQNHQFNSKNQNQVQQIQNQNNQYPQQSYQNEICKNYQQKSTQQLNQTVQQNNTKEQLSFDMSAKYQKQQTEKEISVQNIVSPSPVISNVEKNIQKQYQSNNINQYQQSNYALSQQQEDTKKSQAVLRNVLQYQQDCQLKPNQYSSSINQKQMSTNISYHDLKSELNLSMQQQPIIQNQPSQQLMKTSVQKQDVNLSKKDKSQEIQSQLLALKEIQRISTGSRNSTPSKQLMRNSLYEQKPANLVKKEESLEFMYQSTPLPPKEIQKISTGSSNSTPSQQLMRNSLNEQKSGNLLKKEEAQECQFYQLTPKQIPKISSRSTNLTPNKQSANYSFNFQKLMIEEPQQLKYQSQPMIPVSAKNNHSKSIDFCPNILFNATSLKFQKPNVTLSKIEESQEFMYLPQSMTQRQENRQYHHLNTRQERSKTFFNEFNKDSIIETKK